MTISDRPLPGLTAAPLSVLSRAGSGRSALLRKPAFMGLLATNFLLGLTNALIVPFISIWATQEVGMSARDLGLFMTINSVSAIVTSTVLARWSDSHVTRRHLLLLGSSAGALGYLAFAFLRDPLVLTLIGSSLLAVATINFAQLFAHVREELDRTEHAGADVPFVMGVLRACYALAWTVGPLLSAQIKSQLGFRGIFLGASACFVVFGIFVLAFVVKRPRLAEARPASRERPSWGLGQPVVLLYCIAFALMFSAFTLNTLNLPLFLTRELGATEQAVGVAFGTSPLFEMLFMVWFGHLATGGHQLKVIRFGICAALCYFLLLTLVTAPWQVYPMQILNAAAVAVTVSVVIPFFQDLLPRQAGAATNLYANALKVGGLVGFMSFGLLASRVGNGGLFLVCAALSGVTLGIVLFVRPQTK